MSRPQPASDPHPRLPALTLRRPWAALVIEGHKDYENRGWKPGDWLLGRELAIHAGKSRVSLSAPGVAALVGGLSLSHLADAEGLVGLVTVKGWIDARHGAPSYPDAPRGRIHEGGVVRDATKGELEPARNSTWTSPGAVWWLLSNPRAVKRVVPARGMPGLFRLSHDTEAELRAALVDRHAPCALPARSLRAARRRAQRGA